MGDTPSTAPAAPDDRPERRGGPSQYSDRGQRDGAGRGDTRPPAKGYRSDRSTAPRRDDRSAAPRRDDRPSYPRRDDKPAYQQRDERPAYQSRDDKPAYQKRDDRPQYARNDKPAFQSRDDRPSYPRRDDKPAYQQRDDRSSYQRRDDKPSYQSRDERPAYQKRDDRPSYPRRDDKPAYQQRDDRSSYQRRDDKPSYQSRDERPSYQKRDDRPSSPQRDDRARGGDRPQYQQRDDRSSYQRRDDKPSYQQRDERPSFFNRGEDKPYVNRERPNYEDTRRKDTAPEQAVTVAEDNQFAALGLDPKLVQRLARDGISAPFPIQSATIPDALAGKDVLGRGQTGSGKTLSFGLPTLMRLSGGHTESRRPRGMILVPTRELAMQVHDALEPLAHVMGVSLKLIAGGLPYPKQIESLRRGVDLLIATPGRLIDLCEQGAADLGAVEVAILDEADHMCDMGFMPAVTTLLDMTPKEGQRLLFSATLDNDVDKIVKTYLKDPVTHSTESGQATVSGMEHHLLVIEPGHKQSLTAELASRDGRTIVFVRTKLGADRVATQLRDRGVMAAALHGGLTQGARNRTLDQFKDGSVPVLVATDVAARGIHVDDVGLVVQADPPAEHKDYLHRAGRTARAGGKGAVVTLLLPHQRRGMIRMAETAGVEAEPVRARPGDELVTVLTGGKVPSGHPVRLPAPKPQRGSGGGGGRRFGGGGNSGPRRSNSGPRRDSNGPRRESSSGPRKSSYQH
ncbi:DEAD/DEAH box helicase [Kribbella antibiotica]|uniref:DEAD/DEAH box helicase n=2 Tax=Kribbella antibiotica TaxID=190195 RepID=A0A4V2YNR3_9ACTN|nr:DEAD/DEAH box helicase [Kribbella antibiotica]